MASTSEQKFVVRWIWPLVSLIITAVSFGSFYMNSLSISDLLTVTGEVTKVYQERVKNYKSYDECIVITLDKNRQFYLWDEFRDSFLMIKSEILVGDDVTIAHRTRFQSVIGTGSQFNIMELRKDDQILIPFMRVKDQFTSVGTFGFYTAFGFWAVYLILLLKLKKEKRAHNNVQSSALQKRNRKTVAPRN